MSGFVAALLRCRLKNLPAGFPIRTFHRTILPMNLPAASSVVVLDQFEKPKYGTGNCECRELSAVRDRRRANVKWIHDRGTAHQRHCPAVLLSRGPNLHWRGPRNERLLGGFRLIYRSFTTQITTFGVPQCEMTAIIELDGHSCPSSSSDELLLSWKRRSVCLVRFCGYVSP
jgi:hypothetical protein